MAKKPATISVRLPRYHRDRLRWRRESSAFCMVSVRTGLGGSAIVSIAEKIGYSEETLRTGCGKPNVTRGAAPG